MNKILAFLIIFFLGSMPILQGQKVLEPIVNPPRFKIHHVDHENGLTSAFFVSAYQDRFGFVWLGGQYGLDVYDGYSVRSIRYKDKEGKSSPVLVTNHIMEDNQGELWFCSQGGIYRYERARDELVFYPVDQNDPLRVYCTIMFHDSGGRYWVYTNDGLYRFNRDSSKFIQTGIEVSENWSSQRLSRNPLFEEEDGAVWLPALPNGLYKYDPELDSMINFRHDPENPEGLIGEYYNNILQDKEGNIWVPSYGGGLNKMVNTDKGTCEHYRHDPEDDSSVFSDSISSIMMDRSGNIWVAGRNGFSKYIPETNSFQSYYINRSRFPYSSYSSNIAIREIIEDTYGYLWFRTHAHLGTYCFDPLSETLYRFIDYIDQDDGMTGDNWPFEIFTGDQGLVWVVNESGVNIIERKQNKPFYYYTHDPGDPGSLNHPHITSIYLDRDKTLWIGCQGGVLNEFRNFTPGEPSDFRHYPVFDRIYSPEFVTSITEDESNTLWVGTYTSLNKFHKRTNEFEQFNYTLWDTNNFNFCTDVTYRDRSGNLWFGTRGRGTYVYDPGKKILDDFPRSIYDTAYMSLTDVICMYEDLAGNMWLGHFWAGGITMFPKAERKHFFTDHLPRFKRFTSDPHDPASLSSSQVLHINEDTQGRIWVGTTSGLNLFNPDDETFISFTQDDGLPNDCINSILVDDKGNLWLSTLKGLCKLDLADGISREIINSVRTYGMEDGIFGPVFYEHSCYKSEDGWMFFGGNDGMTVFHPDSIRENLTVPEVYITEMKINDIQVSDYKEIDINRSLQETDQVKLSYKQNFLSFEYVALNYINAGGNRYKYMMEGLDEDWVEAGIRRFAEYRDLKPGDYTFRVIGSNDDGVWNEEGASIGISIRPPWYRTILAYILYIILLSSGVIVIVRWITIQLRIENLRLDKMVKERTRTIEEQNEEIKATNAELEEQKEEIMATNTQLEEQKEELVQQREEIMSTNTQLEEQKEELEQQKEELQITLDQLKETQAQLIQSEKLAALGGLVAGVAHEINTPVGISLTASSSLEEETARMAELYKEDKLSRADFKDYLNTANQSAKLILANMQRTAEMVQSFKQVSADQATEKKRKFKLKSYTDDVIRSLYPKLKDRRIHIDLDIDEKLEIDSFPGAFSQIITNLVLNSLTHGFDEGKKGNIEIKATMENNKLKLLYSDNGKGIPEGILNKIFEPFFTTNKSIGTGLGMHIVYNLVTQKLNGKIDCESGVGKGTKFKIEIPV